MTKTVVIRSMRTVKQQTLKLLQTFFQNCSEQDKESVLKQFVPELLDPVLNDYKSNVPDARDAEVLSLFAVIIDKFAVRTILLELWLVPSCADWLCVPDPCAGHDGAVGAGHFRVGVPVHARHDHQELRR